MLRLCAAPAVIPLRPARFPAAAVRAAGASCQTPAGLRPQWARGALAVLASVGLETQRRLKNGFAKAPQGVLGVGAALLCGVARWTGLLSRRVGQAVRRASTGGDRRVEGLQALEAPRRVRDWLDKLDPDIQEIIATIEGKMDRRGEPHRAWIVGGAVRDAVSGRIPKDVDLATTMTPSEMVEYFPRAISYGAKYGVITVRHKGAEVECSMLRTGTGSEGTRLNAVPAETLREDLAFRDFTMNAMAVDSTKKLLYDPFGGLEHIRQRVVCAVSQPALRILQNDSLRALRAYRFLGYAESAENAWELDSELQNALRQAPKLLAKASSERIRDELRKIWSQPATAAAVTAQMRQDGILAAALRLEASGEAWRRVDEPDVFRAVESLCNHPVFAQGPNFLQVLILLLKGLPTTCQSVEEVSVEAVCGALRLSKDDTKYVLLHHSCLGKLPAASDERAIRRFMAVYGMSGAKVQLPLEEALAASSSSEQRQEKLDEVAALREKVEKVDTSHMARPLADGKWVKETTGLQGAAVGFVKEWLHLQQVDENIKDRARLEEVLRQLDLSDPAKLSSLPGLAWPPDGRPLRSPPKGRRRGRQS